MQSLFRNFTSRAPRLEHSKALLPRTYPSIDSAFSSKSSPAPLNSNFVFAGSAPQQLVAATFRSQLRSVTTTANSAVQTPPQNGAARSPSLCHRPPRPRWCEFSNYAGAFGDQSLIIKQQQHPFYRSLLRSASQQQLRQFSNFANEQRDHNAINSPDHHDKKELQHARPSKKQPFRKQTRLGGKFPTFEEAQQMPRDWHELDNVTLWVHCGPKGIHDANEERMIREIMRVDCIDYSEAVRRLLEMQEHIIGGKTIYRHLGLLPYKGGMLLAGMFGFSTVPLIFHKETVLWFNEVYVTADVPEPKDLETWLEVGSFAWQWMEPLIGQLSFLILVAQYMRNQLLNLGLKPYTGMLINYRCSRARERYPEYSETILTDYATTISWEGRRRPHDVPGKQMARRRSVRHSADVRQH